MTVLCFRTFCDTEDDYVFSWGLTPPTQCPNNSQHTIDTNSTTVVNQVSVTDTHVVNNRKTLYNNIEYNLSTTSNGSDSASIKSVQHGKYIAGMTCEVGLGIRIPALPTGNQVMKWGYYDDDNGYYFKLTSSGLSINILRDYVEESIPQSQWNKDTVDGNGKSRYTLDVTAGIIYTIDFSWYGFGAIIFGIIGTDEHGDTTHIPVHSFLPFGQTSTL